MTEKAIIMIVLIVLCVPSIFFVVYNIENKSRDAMERNSNIRYIKDHKSGLCFAVDQGYQMYGIAHVPCEAVEDLLHD